MKIKNNIVASGFLALCLSSVFAVGSAQAGVFQNILPDGTVAVIYEDENFENPFGVANWSREVDLKLAGIDWFSVSAGAFRLAEENVDNEILMFSMELDDTLLDETGAVNVNQFEADFFSFENDLSALQVTRLQKLFGEYLGELEDADTAAAFQIVAWEIVYDDDLNLSTGDFQLASNGLPFEDLIENAGSMLDGLDGITNFMNLGFLTSEKSVDLVYAEVSAPATAILLTLGFGALVARRKTK